jgi:Ala-tRNA(Pro) deacylase
MPVEKLKTYLDEHDVKYVTIKHSRAYTAQEVAASAHIPGKRMAKSVMVKLDGEMAMAVLPASYQVDLDQLRARTGADVVELAGEDEFEALFPECELGAMPPFGRLYGMKTFMAAALADDEEIAFNAGSHTELIQLSYREYVRLEDPIVLHFALEPA